ncbi:MAG TPA: DUF488 domain-containing protein [Candidatus Kapabacteria bacterium]|nr:DUF488 domain-containing protein [Candidatus Kapabacteria bacterium]
MNQDTLHNNTVFTIGHSTHPIDKFLQLLSQHRIQAIADARSVPYSKYQPQFGKEVLAKALKTRGIDYVFLGKELGARSDDPSCYVEGRVQYRKLAETSSFRSGLDRVIRGSRNQRIAIMCTEGEPLECHRTLLVSRELTPLGVTIVHIHSDGHLESHHDILERLLSELKMQDDFFCTHDELIERAYAKQESAIAYVPENIGQPDAMNA